MNENIESETEDPQELVLNENQELMLNEPQQLVLNEPQQLVLNELPILPPRISKRGLPKGNSKFLIKVYYFTYLNHNIICK